MRVDAGLRYCPAVISANGRVKPDWVLVNDKEEKHPEGSYYLDWYDDEKRKRVSVGKDSVQALNRKLKKEAELKAIANGVEVVPEGSATSGTRLTDAIADFLEETKPSKKPKTFQAYSTTLAYFAEFCEKTYVEQVDRKDMLRFSSFLREKGQSPRSVWNKFNNTMSFLKAQGLTKIVSKNDWHKFVQEEPEVYEKDELERLFAVFSEEERLLFRFYQQTGMREQEVNHRFREDNRCRKLTQFSPDYRVLVENLYEP